MEKNMQVNFEFLERRVLDSLDKTDLEYIRSELKKLNEPTIVCGVGGSSVVSEFGSKVIKSKNEVISINSEPRDFAYNRFTGFKNVVSCSYSGNNYGVELTFNNDLKKYLLSNNSFQDEDVTYLKYDTTIDKERSFISIGTTLIPISILLNYYLNGDNKRLYDFFNKYEYNFEVNADAYEIFSGIDTSTTSKYLESTLVESGIGIPIVHDKYSYCHGRSTTSINFNNLAIYLYRGTELDNLLLEELKKYYKDVIVLKSVTTNPILDDYQMLIQAMYLTKYIAEQKQKDLSVVEYSPVVKKLYKYHGRL
ncbi:MAG: hypothetical protein PHS98_03065 [Bacilli bacterium]|nr:hypothetical protein [Bacilli bacterium]